MRFDRREIRRVFGVSDKQISAWLEDQRVRHEYHSKRLADDNREREELRRLLLED